MAQLNITIPDAEIPRIRAAFARRLGKDAADVTAEDIRQAIINSLKTGVRQYEQREAENAIVITDIDAT